MALVPERVTLTPKEEKGERFFLAGIALSKVLVAPTGHDRTYRIQVRNFIAR